MPKISFGPSQADLEEQQRQEELARQRQIEQEKIEAAKLRALESEVRAHNREKEKRLAIYKRKARNTKAAVITCLVLFMGVFIFFGVYNTFIKKTLTPETVMPLVESVRNLNAKDYPSDGVEGFLRENATTIISKYINSSNTYYIDPNTLYVTMVAVKSPTVANAYFAVDITTQEKDTRDEEGNVIPGRIQTETYNFFVPVIYDANIYSYYLGGVVEMTLRPTYNQTSIAESPFLAFVDLDSENKSEFDELPTKDTALNNIVTPFLMNLYNNPGVPLENYLSKDFSTENLLNAQQAAKGKKFIAVSEFRLYTQSNKMGYNGYVDYVIETDIGFQYTTRTYMLILQTESGQWLISGLL